MDSQEFAQENPWISFGAAFRIAEQHNLNEELYDEILLGGYDVKTRVDAKGRPHGLINTQSLVDWLGY